jgi:hypothetical protein
MRTAIHSISSIEIIRRASSVDEARMPSHGSMRSADAAYRARIFRPRAIANPTTLVQPPWNGCRAMVILPSSGRIK